MMTQNGIKNLTEVLPNDVFASTEWLWEITKKIWADEEKKKKLEDRRLKIKKLKENVTRNDR